MNSLENEISYVSLLGKIKMDTNKTPCKCKLVLVEFKIQFSLFLNFDILSNVHYAEIEGTKCLAHSNLKVPSWFQDSHSFHYSAPQYKISMIVGNTIPV